MSKWRSLVQSKTEKDVVLEALLKDGEWEEEICPCALCSQIRSDGFHFDSLYEGWDLDRKVRSILQKVAEPERER